MRRREKHNGARQETFACHMVKATAKARNTRRMFAARLMRPDVGLGKNYALGVAATGDSGGLRSSVWVAGLVAKQPCVSGAIHALGGETRGNTLQTCPECGQVMELSGSGGLCTVLGCKRNGGGFSICESHSSTRQTLNAMQMLLSVGLYLM
jgi:hypothetical protein